MIDIPDRFQNVTEGESILNFAYGSNMLRGRLEKRVGGIQKVGVAYLPDYRLRANKISDDDSSKANIEPYAGGRVWGVLWSVPVAEREGLDSAEGYSPVRRNNHYEPHMVTVYDVNGKPMDAMAYIACDGRTTEEDFPMYAWYHRFLMLGAEENGLTKEYMDEIDRLPKIDDGDRTRHLRNMRITMEQ